MKPSPRALVGRSLEHAFISRASKSRTTPETVPPLLRQTTTTLLCLALATSLLPAAGAQENIFLEFKFQDLRFRVWPAGLEHRSSIDGKGSAITVHVNDVRVENEGAVELRYCIDEPEYCSNDVADGDGTVEDFEVQNFENLTKLGIRYKIKRVDELLDALKANLSVDGAPGKSSSITNAKFSGAEGPVDSNARILATIEAKVTFDNDGKAARHTIHVGNLSLKQDGFTYTNALWTLASPGWRFDAAATQPDAARPHVNSQGYFSNQAQFESLSGAGFDLTVVKETARKKSPGPELALILLALPLALLLRRTHA